MDQEKIKAYYQMWSEAWKVFRKWAIDFQDDNSYWQRLVREGDAFITQYRGTAVETLAKKVVLDIIEELELTALKEGKQ